MTVVRGRSRDTVGLVFFDICERPFQSRSTGRWSPTRVSYSYQLFERCANRLSVIPIDRARERIAAV
jgi:hypothetical protein